MKLRLFKSTPPLLHLSLLWATILFLPLNATSLFNHEKLDSLLQQFPTLTSTHKQKLSGTPLILYGTVQDTTGKPLKQATVEIWQTDAEGYYNHPRERSTDKRNRNFQFFGIAKSDEQGTYHFRTLVPGEYFPRPRHIHLKVKHQNRTLLTSQFYFKNKIVKLPNTPALTQIQNSNRRPLYPPVIYYRNTLIAQGDLVVTSLSNSSPNNKFTPTPSQTEGPYYPVVSLNSYDNDLLILK